MPRQSAGLLAYRFAHGELEVFLVHPGGPYWARKDAGAWSIPKGEFEPRDDPREAARREFEEETGFVPRGELIPLTPRKQPGGKLIHVWAVQGDWEPAQLRSNSFSMEWPRGSGRMQEFPEVDQGAWFALAAARHKLLPGQVPFVEELALTVSGRPEMGS